MVLKDDNFSIVKLNAGLGEAGTFGVSADVSDGEFGGVEFDAHPDVPDFVVEGFEKSGGI